MMPWLINFKDKTVVIVGGGAVASRKALQFLKEGAKVKIIASRIDRKLEALEVEKYLTDYQPKYLQNAFFVYIATDDRELNNQIIRDADELGVLCACATSSMASLKAMKVVETENLLLGISTKGQYPAFTKKLAYELEQYDDYLSALSNIRRLVLLNNLVNKHDRKQFFKQLMYFEKTELDMLLMFILEKEGRLLIFTAQCMNVIDYFAEQVSAMSLCLKEIDFQDKLKILMMLKIKWQIQPMVISYGKIYDKISKMCSPKEVAAPLFNSEILLEQLYSNKVKRLFIIHPRSNSKLFDILSRYGSVCAFNIKIIGEYEQIIPFVLLPGYHYQNDILKAIENVKGQLTPVLLEDKQVVALLTKEISRRFGLEKVAI
ncbi:siroheme synthase [Thomasclavelia ramosa]|uniref:precorrin-2 dehydrogenase/sirohydrochlorin ferrochelatase family protein n=1 Tax=Thomasclavelia ramosa TaxID=1547 RepID=UPI000E53559D|nr:bifunctional precorrin-2 dehydrogenase/sirohydrochlorin ferrochelatase [Thomasclavelia ramosa]RGX61712.1 siroheme synthase [Thomasclavelia ramosa]